MTTPTQTRLVAPPRQLAAWALVGYTGLFLVFAFFDWVLPGASFGVRSAGADFTRLVELALPLIGELIATGAGFASELPSAKLISTVALVEYAAAVLLGALAWIFGIGTAGGDGARGTFDALGYLVLGLGRVALVALAGLAVYRVFTRLGGSLALPRLVWTR